MIDLQLLQVEKGGNPEVVRESQRKRFASVELVDEVLSLYKNWVTLEFQLNQMQQEVNAIQKVITTKKRRRRTLMPSSHKRKNKMLRLLISSLK